MLLTSKESFISAYWTRAGNKTYISVAVPVGTHSRALDKLFYLSINLIMDDLFLEITFALCSLLAIVLVVVNWTGV